MTKLQSTRETGIRKVSLTAREAKNRRMKMSELICCGASNDEIEDGMSTLFPGITRREIKELKERTKTTLLSEHDEQTPVFKVAAVRRLMKHIERASSARQWGAVANLESQLSRIQGTESPPEIKVSVTAQLQQATMHVLGLLNPNEVQNLIAEELKRIQSPERPKLGAYNQIVESTPNTTEEVFDLTDR